MVVIWEICIVDIPFIANIAKAVSHVTFVYVMFWVSQFDNSCDECQKILLIAGILQLVSSKKEKCLIIAPFFNILMLSPFSA